MSVNQRTKWLTVCLYYNEPWEEFLLKGIKPYVDVIMQTGIADYYFFQRCWERGPHIKLWFKGNVEILENMLKPNLEEHFRHYFESKPSFRKEPTYPDKFPDNSKWYSNDSIQYVENPASGPDLGSPIVHAIAQKQFNSSSDMVLEALKTKRGRWSFDDVTSTAIKLHLSFAFATGMDLVENAFFFDLLWQSWQPDSSKNASFTRQKRINKETHQQSFEKIYHLQKLDLAAFTAALWEALEHDRNIGQESYEAWIHTNISINIELGLIQDAGKLSKKIGGFPLIISSIEEDKVALWLLYAEFIHQTNIRLGLKNKDEGYIYFMMKNSLKAVLTKYQAHSSPYSKSFNFDPFNSATK